MEEKVDTEVLNNRPHKEHSRWPEGWEEKSMSTAEVLSKAGQGQDHNHKEEKKRHLEEEVEELRKGNKYEESDNNTSSSGSHESREHG